MSLPTEEELCIFVQKSIANRQYNEEIVFSLPLLTIEKVKKSLPFNMLGYHCVISSHAIRHIKRGHPNDLDYICKIIEILENFTKVKKSITKCSITRATLVSLEFYKKFDNDVVKLVKLKVHRDKRLELKTLFVKD